jgi:succinate dehydrogenase / fumarate reductase, flavoprotein subunit
MGKEKIMSRVPFCWEEAHRLVGVDAVTQPMPVRPTVHYCMGGIPVNTDGRVRAGSDELVDGFFAAGETSCVSVHGANRLGSNSLLECVVYGRRTGASIAQYVQNRKLPELDVDRYIRDAKEQIEALFNQSGQYRIQEIRQAYQDCMTEHCGVFRTEEVMQSGLAKLRELQQKYSQIRLDDRGNSWNTELIEALELRSLFVVGEMILFSAINRKESRGSHFREDYAQRDDAAFLKHTLAYYSAAGIDINYMPVVINQFEPQERN